MKKKHSKYICMFFGMGLLAAALPSVHTKPEKVAAKNPVRAEAEVIPAGKDSMSSNTVAKQVLQRQTSTKVRVRKEIPTEAPTEAPVTEAPIEVSTEAPKTEAPKTEAPKTEAPKTEAAKKKTSGKKKKKPEEKKTEAPETEAQTEAAETPTEAPTEAPKKEEKKKEETAIQGPAKKHLTKSGGVCYYSKHKETWYNLDMSGVIKIMRDKGYGKKKYPYWTRDDGVKMFGDYVMVAANTNQYPKGTIVTTSLGTGMVVDHCASAANSDTIWFDIAVTW